MKTAEKIAYWLDIAEYDMKTARSLQKSGRYLYTVFMCQQAIEKILSEILKTSEELFKWLKLKIK